MRHSAGRERIRRPAGHCGFEPRRGPQRHPRPGFGDSLTIAPATTSRRNCTAPARTSTILKPTTSAAFCPHVLLGRCPGIICRSSACAARSIGSRAGEGLGYRQKFSGNWCEFRYRMSLPDLFCGLRAIIFQPASKSVQKRVLTGKEECPIGEPCFLAAGVCRLPAQQVPQATDLPSHPSSSKTPGTSGHRHWEYLTMDPQSDRSTSPMASQFRWRTWMPARSHARSPDSTKPARLRWTIPENTVTSATARAARSPSSTGKHSKKWWRSTPGLNPRSMVFDPLTRLLFVVRANPPAEEVAAPPAADALAPRRTACRAWHPILRYGHRYAIANRGRRDYPYRHAGFCRGGRKQPGLCQRD